MNHTNHLPSISDAILYSRVGLPPLRHNMIERDRLHTAQPHQVLTLIAAPAGFGKSTLLAAWAHRQTTPVAWLSLEPSDNEFSRWMRYLMAAFEKRGIDFELPLHQIALHTPEEALHHFLNTLSASPTPALLALDDYHFIDNPDIHEAMCFLLEHWPQSGHVLLATREAPPFPLALWQAKARMTSLQMDALRFRSDEASGFLQQTMGLSCTPELSAQLHAQTEGWAAGLQLAALAIRSHNSREQALSPHLALHHEQVVVDYVEQEILAQQPEEIRDFIIHTSLLDRFNEALCVHLTDRQESQQILEQLEQTQLFLLRLSNHSEDQQQRGTWFRYHHLFAQIIRSHLQRTHPALARSLHQRASHWFAQRGDLTEALHHAITGEDWPQAADWLLEYLPPLQMAGENWSIAQWLERLPRVWLQERPQLGLAWISAKASMSGRTDEIDQLLDALERSILATNQAPQTHEQTDLQAMLYRTRMELSWHLREYERALTYAQDAQRALPTHFAGAHAYCKMLEGYIRDFQAAPPAEVQALFAQSSELAQRSQRQWSTYIFASWGAAWVDVECARPHRAARACQRILDEVNRHPPQQAPPAFMLAAVYAMQAHLALEWGHKEAALQSAQAAISRLHRNLSWEVHHYIKTIWAYAQYANEQSDAVQETLLHTVRGLSFLSPRDSIYASLIPFRLRSGDLNAAIQWAESCAFSLDEPFAKDWIIGYCVHISVLMAQREFTQAHSWIDALSAYVHRIERTRYMLDLQVLQAILLAAQGQHEQALDTLQDAIAQATPGAYIRPFLEHHHALAPLFAHLPLQPNAPITPQDMRYREQLWSAMGGIPHQPTHPAQTPDEPDDDTYLSEGLLSRRELEILQQTARGLTNREIASTLHISAETVKSHMKNIFQKLEVKNRTQAVAQARQQQLFVEIDDPSK